MTPAFPEQFRRLFAAGADQARDLLATEGYFSAEISAALDQTGDTWTARFKVLPGEPSRVESVDIGFEGADAGSEADFAARRERIRQQWPLTAGTRFRQAAWTDAKDKALGALLEEWFPAARIAASEARVDPERRSVDLAVTLDSGPVFTLGELLVTGLERYPRETVDNLNRIATGSPLQPEGPHRPARAAAQPVRRPARPLRSCASCGSWCAGAPPRLIGAVYFMFKA